MQNVGGVRQIFPVRIIQCARTEGMTVYTGLCRQNTVCKLFLAHFQAENGHRNFLLFGHIGGNIQRKTCFAHTGTCSQNNQVRTAHSGKDSVQVRKSGGNTAVFRLIRSADFLQGRQCFHNSCRQAGHGIFILSGSNIIKLALGALQKGGGVGFFIALAQNSFGRIHHTAAKILLLYNAGIGAHIVQTGNGFGQAREVAFCHIWTFKNIILDDRIQHRYNVYLNTTGKQIGHCAENATIFLGIEHLRLKSFHQFRQNLIAFQQCCTQHRLFCHHIVLFV
ncbi:hypothetical protein EVA_08014 [gut metagenome]|uniref:Uncharacterized protein n=1 Tax=gut metagenome TaxID=749906 RepID=J9CUH8_9ZZZZ